MLSTIPKLADKAFIIGFLLPVIVFLAAVLFLFADYTWVADVLKLFLNTGNIEGILYMSLLVWCLAIAMMMLNRILYQVVEGYLWPISNLGRAWPREMRRFAKKTRRFDELAQQWKLVGNHFPEALKREYDGLLVELVTQFPSEDRLILPTRFGNAIRAFEDYSRQVYGADSIPLWIHLNTVIPKEFQASLEDAQAQVNCLLNLLFFASIMFLLSVARSIRSLCLPASFNVNVLELLRSESVYFALFAFCSALVAWLAYNLSIERIYEWGSLVKAAFDCYLPDLAKRLGYELPLTGDDQKKFWIAVSRRAIYHRPLNPEEWPRADDLDQGAEHDKTSSTIGRENVSEQQGGEGDDANDEAVENEDQNFLSNQFFMSTAITLLAPIIHRFGS